MLLNLCVSQTTDGLCFIADFQVVYDMNSKNLSRRYNYSSHRKCLELFKFEVSYNCYWHLNSRIGIGLCCLQLEFVKILSDLLVNAFLIIQFIFKLKGIIFGRLEALKTH